MNEYERISTKSKPTGEGEEGEEEHCNKKITDTRIVTKRSGHFVPIALIGLGKLLHRLCAFDFFKGNIALQNSLHDLPFFQSYMQRLAKAWYRKGRRMLCKYQTL